MPVSVLRSSSFAILVIMNDTGYLKLAEAIQSIYLNLGKYRFDKHVPVFKLDDTYLADCFNITILEPRELQAPIFYHIYSPYDVVSKKAPQYATIFQAGNVLLHVEVTSYVNQRTGVMSPLVLRTLGAKDVANKNILFVGTGNIARCALAAFKEFYPDLQHVDFINSGSDAEEFLALAAQLQLTASRSELNRIGEYDVIICHSSATQPVLSADLQERVKPGALITTFASEDHSDISKEYYDTNKANIIVDWQHTIDEASELQSAVAEGLARQGAITTLEELFNGKYTGVGDKRYTVYRSHGAPMHDLAYLQQLLK